MNKKRVFAIVLFIVLGLFMYTFANPLNDDNNNDANANQSGNSQPATNNNSADPISYNEDVTLDNPTRNNTRRAVNNRTAVISVPSTAPTVVVDLSMDKANAIEELKNYKKGYEFYDDSEYNKVIEEFTKKINESETKTDINKNLDDGKKAIDELIAEDLAEYKKAAKEEINKYKEELNLSTDVTELIKEAFDNIDKALGKNEVDELVENTKKALDEVAAEELEAAIAAAKEEIKNYRTEDEKYVSEVTDTKNDIYDRIDKVTNKEDLPQVVTDGKTEIDGVIANKTFSVSFYDINRKLIATKTVKYQEAATAPEVAEKVKKFNKYVVYIFKKWNKDFTSVKSDMKVYAKYNISKAFADVYAEDDKIVEKVQVVLTNETRGLIKAFSGNDISIEISDVTAYVKATLPTIYKNNKYKTITYNSIKMTANGFVVNGSIYYDELGEAKDQLKELIKEAKKVDTTGKTDASINKLNDDIATAERALTSDDLEVVKASIEALSNIELVDIKVTEVKVVNKKAEYFANEDFVLEVKYSDNNGTTDKVITTGYTVSEKATTPGRYQGTVTYKGVESNKFDYVIKEVRITSISVVSAKYEYFLNEDYNITVTATNNDGSTRVLDSSEYRVTGFVNQQTTYKGKKNHPKTAKVHLTAPGYGNIHDTFEYSISTYTRDEWNKKRTSDISVRLDKKNHTLVFDGLDEDISIKDARKEYTIFGIKYDDHVFNLISTNKHNVYKLSDTDYDKIKDTNTFILMQILKITYVVDNKEYSYKYIEFFNDLY